MKHLALKSSSKFIQKVELRDEDGRMEKHVENVLEHHEAAPTTAQIEFHSIFTHSFYLSVCV